jgi:hypothetical protein
MEKAGLSLIARWPERDADMGVTEEHLRYAIQYSESAQRNATRA